MGFCDMNLWRLWACAHAHCDSDASQVKLGSLLFKLRARETCPHRPGSIGPYRLLNNASMTIVVCIEYQQTTRPAAYTQHLGQQHAGMAKSGVWLRVQGNCWTYNDLCNHVQVANRYPEFEEDDAFAWRKP